MKSFFLLGLSFLMTYSILSAQTNLDSLWTVWNDVEQQDTVRLEAITKFSKDGFLYSNPDSAYQLAQLQLNFAQEHNLPKYEGIALNTQGIALLILSKPSEAIKHFQQVKAIREEINDQAGVGYVLNNIGRVYFDEGDFEKAIDLYKESLSVQQSVGNKRGAAIAMGNIANIYNNQGNLIKAMEYFTKTLKVMEELGNKDNIAACKINMANIYLDLNDFEKAESFFREGIALCREINHVQFLGNATEGLGNLMFDKGEYDEALKLQRESYEIRYQMGYGFGAAVGLHNIGMVYSSMGQNDSAEIYFERSLAFRRELGTQDGVLESLNSLATLYTDLGRYQQAIELSQEALPIAERLGDRYEISRSNNTLALSYDALGKPSTAYPFLRKAFSIRDSLTDDRIQREVLRQEYQYEYEKQVISDSLQFVQEKAETELSYQQQLANRNYLLFGAIGIAILAFLFFRYRQQLRNRQRELELQQERERKEQLAELNGMKSRFFANISHEFRTPLTLVLGRNQMMQAKLDDPALDPQFDEVDRNGRRLLELVNQVLDLSKLEAGNMRFNPETIDLVPFLKNILFSFESLADQKAQKLTFEHEHETLLIVADPEKLERIFYNLLANAIKYSPEQAEIFLKLQVIAHRTHISVKDNGPGIAAEEIPFVFDRFYQASSADETTSPGTGIGLALAKELVELHEGTLAVESELGMGSTFWAELPLDNMNTEAKPTNYQPQLEPLQSLSSEATPAMVASAPQNASRVLIVEDNPDVRAYLRDELKDLNYEVIEAENGKEGLAQARSTQPDLIISDVMMPRMDGFEFAEAIRQDVNSSHIPIIMLTAKASEESKLEGLKIGADAYLTKPFNREELKVRVAKLIEQRQHLRQRFSTAMQIRPEEVSAVPMDQAFLQKVTAIIEENLANDQFGVEPLAEQVGMSSVYLNRKLNALIGQSAGKLIRSMRLQRAADLLKANAGTISEIAYDLGFSSPNNFTRSFKQQFGVTPKAWAKGIKS